MYYPQELPRPRARPPLYGSNINKNELFKTSNQGRSKKSKFLGLLKPYIREYCETSSVHGFRYLTAPKLHHIEKLIWLLIMVVTFIGAIFVYVDLIELYNTGRKQTTIENTMQPIFYLYFPSVALCPLNHVNWLKLENEAPDYFLGNNATVQQKELFKRFFEAASAVRIDNMGSLRTFFKNATLEANVSQLNDLNVNQVLEYVQLQCSDIFADCKWRGKPQNCCEILELQYTEMGLCWVFNSAVGEEFKARQKMDKYYPRRTAQYGQGTGLDIQTSLKKSLTKIGVSGINVMIKQPEQWSDNTRLVPINAHNRISVAPRFTATDQRTRDLSASERGCIFPDETHDPLYKNLPGFVYWRGNCRTRCHQEYMVNLCKCSTALLFPNNKKDNFTDCKASDFKCLYDNRQTFSVEHLPLEQEYVDYVNKESMICDCLNSCTQMTYDTFFGSTVMDSSNIDPETITMRIDIFFQSQWFIKYRTHMRFTFVELLANFGGIIGLFLGASMLSAAELIYYFTIGLYLHTVAEGNRKSMQQPQAPPTISVHFQRRITPNKISY